MEGFPLSLSEILLILSSSHIKHQNQNQSINMSKPITLYGHGEWCHCNVAPEHDTDGSLAIGPNPWKVAIILEELKIPYTTKFMG